MGQGACYRVRQRANSATHDEVRFQISSQSSEQSWAPQRTVRLQAACCRHTCLRVGRPRTPQQTMGVRALLERCPAAVYDQIRPCQKALMLKKRSRAPAFRTVVQQMRLSAEAPGGKPRVQYGVDGAVKIFLPSSMSSIPTDQAEPWS